jgi:hypothetical protein
MTCGGIEGGVNNATGTPLACAAPARECNGVSSGNRATWTPTSISRGWSQQPSAKTSRHLRTPKGVRTQSGQVVSLGGHSPSTTYRFPYTYRFSYTMYGIMYVETMKGVTCGGRARLTTPAECRVQTPIPTPHNVRVSRTSGAGSAQLSVHLKGNSCACNTLRFDIITVIGHWHAHTRPPARGAAS